MPPPRDEFADNNNEPENENETEYVYNEANFQNENVEKPKTILTAIEEGNVEELQVFLKTMSDTKLQHSKDTQGLVNIATAEATEDGLNNATKQRRLDILRLLLDAKFNPNEPNPSNPRQTPLNIAVRGSENINNVISTLIQEGAKVDGIGTTIPPIFDAIQSQNLAALKELHVHGVDVNKQWANKTPLQMAIIHKWFDGVQLLLNIGANISAIDIIGDNIFIAAVKLKEDADGNKNKIIRLLRRKNIRADFKNKANKTALMIAAQNGDLETLNTLLEDSRFLTTLNLDTGKGTALALVFQRMFELPDPREFERLLQTINLLVEKGAILQDVQIKKGSFSYPLIHFVVDSGDIAMVELVLNLLGSRALAAINSTDGPGGLTPLGYAAEKNNVEMMRFLVEKGADVNASESESETKPIVIAVTNGALEAFNFLVESGAETDDSLLRFAVIFSEEEEKGPELLKRIIAILQKPGFTINPRDHNGRTPLMTVAKEGKRKTLKVLLENGADPTLTKEEGNPLTPTAYDMAKDMSIRLTIAPYLETDEPRFRGFLKDDFERFNLVFDDLVNFVLCPFCFLPLEHGGGCMYIFEHSCLREKERQQQAGYRSLPIIHEKLFQTYKDAKQNITVCHHCNRAGYTWPEQIIGGQELVGHAHIELDNADTFIVPTKAERGFGANYYDRSGCVNEGGGSHNEKLLRIQVLLNFMCFMNQHFVGKISNLRAHLLAREMFWDAPLYNGTYLTSKNFLEDMPDIKIGDRVPALKTASIKEIIEKLRTDKAFINICEHPTELLPLPEGVVNVEERARVYPNIPRYGTNAVDLAPVQEVTDNGENFCWWYFKFDLFGMTENDGIKGHNDGRPLYRFRHRQPGRIQIHDHGSDSLELKELICAACLESFLRFQTIDAVNADKKIACFSDTCKGHFHPSELQGIIGDEAYQAYKGYYNRFAPVLGGGKRNQETDYPPLIGQPAVVEQDSCPVRFRGGKKRTRRVRKTKKTRKVKRHSKTRRTK